MYDEWNVGACCVPFVVECFLAGLSVPRVLEIIPV